MSNDLDDSLRAALRPVDPGERFTQRVMASLASEPTRAARAVTLQRSWLALAASVLLALVIAQAWHVRRMQQGLEARRQLIEALRVTGQKLDLAYRAVNDSQRRATSRSGA